MTPPPGSLAAMSQPQLEVEIARHVERLGRLIAEARRRVEVSEDVDAVFALNLSSSTSDGGGLTEIWYLLKEEGEHVQQIFGKSHERALISADAVEVANALDDLTVFEP